MKLTAVTRDSNASLEALRAEGKIPAVCYGKKDDSQALSLDASEFTALYRDAGGSAIIELEGVGDSKDVLIKDVQRHALTEDILHVDLYIITKGEEIEAVVPVEFSGDAPVEKAGGVVVKVIREFTVRAMPKDLPSEIVVDLSVLAEVGSSIQVKDINVPSGVTLLADEDEAVVTASATQEYVEEETPTEIDMDAIQSEQKGKGEEEESSGE